MVKALRSRDRFPVVFLGIFLKIRAMKTILYRRVWLKFYPPYSNVSLDLVYIVRKSSAHNVFEHLLAP